MSAKPHFSVTVHRDGEHVVTIETNCLSGRDIGPEDEIAIRAAAHHLLAFIGDAAPSNAPAAEQQPRPMCQNCKWWTTYPGSPFGTGICRGGPPLQSAAVHNSRQMTSAAWPATSPDDWCGQFEPKD